MQPVANMFLRTHFQFSQVTKYSFHIYIWLKYFISCSNAVSCSTWRPNPTSYLTLLIRCGLYTYFYLTSVRLYWSHRGAGGGSHDARQLNAPKRWPRLIWLIGAVLVERPTTPSHQVTCAGTCCTFRALLVCIVHFTYFLKALKPV